MNEKIYVVETISLFRHTYYVKAKESSHALDEVVCRINDEDFIEGSQNHISEDIANVIEVTEEEYLKLFDKENDYLKNWTEEQKLDRINVIEYWND
jgi:predicted nucleic acid-binding OB-fold protein